MDCAYVKSVGIMRRDFTHTKAGCPHIGWAVGRTKWERKKKEPKKKERLIARKKNLTYV